MGKSTLEQAVKAQKKSSTALLFFEPRRWEVVGGEFLSPSRLSLEKDSVPIVQEAGWVPGPVWTSAENLASNGIRSPDRPTHSESNLNGHYRNMVGKSGLDLTTTS